VIDFINAGNAKECCCNGFKKERKVASLSEVDEL